jgi:hypothetical protein
MPRLHQNSRRKITLFIPNLTTVLEHLVMASNGYKSNRASKGPPQDAAAPPHHSPFVFSGKGHRFMRWQG